MPAEIVGRLVDIEPARHVGRALDEHAARRSHVHRVEVETILDVGRVGIAQLFEQRLLRDERGIGLDVEGNVMRCARAEGPRSRRARRLVMQIDDAARTTSASLEPMDVAIDSELAKTHRLDEELLLLLDTAYRHHRAEESTRRDVGADLIRHPRAPQIVARLDDLEQHTGRMTDANGLRAEALLDLAVLDLVAGEVIFPERRGAGGHGIRGDRDLAGTWSAAPAAVGKRSRNRSDLSVCVSPVEVVNRNPPVHQHRLLDEALPEDLGVEIQIFLCRTRAQRDVVDALYEGGHTAPPGS